MFSSSFAWDLGFGILSLESHIDREISSMGESWAFLEGGERVGKKERYWVKRRMGRVG